MTKVLFVLLLCAGGNGLYPHLPEATCCQTELLIIRKKNVVRLLHGVVLDPRGQPVEDADVEVLDNAEWIVRGRSWSPVEQSVVASAKTNTGGKFRFKNLPAGKYDVRIRAMGFDETHLYVEVKPRNGRVKGIRINLELAT